MKSIICVLSLCPILVLSGAGHAQVYKWVDEKGRTHYSERKEDAGPAKPAELKLQTLPALPTEAKSYNEQWREQERRLRERMVSQEVSAPAAPSVPRSLSGGREDGSNASRCALARDVLSGAVRHGNGAPIDKYDRDIAEKDIRAFCK